MRKIVEFDCSDEQLYGSLDTGNRDTGLLIVSGGNEVRAGAHRGMALLAARLAADGFPVFRFDRRGVGDSSGPNLGFNGSRPDFEAAVRTFRQLAPRVRQLVAFGNCDAATALLLFGGAADRLVIANPWLRLGNTGDNMPPPDAIRAHYADRLRDPASWVRALSGGIDLGKLISGLGRAANPGAHRDIHLEHAMFKTLRARPSTRILVAARDMTGMAFLAAARRHRFDSGITLVDTDSHSFARPGDDEQLYQALREALDGG